MLPMAEKDNLVSIAKSILSDVCTKKLGRMKHAPRIETDFTGSFIENGVPALHHEFDKTLKRYSIRVATRAVYIHQSPMISIAAKPPRPMLKTQCELGDIALIFSHRRNSRKTYWRAALWQLKIDSGGSGQPGDPQRWLYEAWPLFNVYRGGLAPGGRDFSGDVRSGYYGFVSKSGWLICPPTGHISSTSMSTVDAGSFIVEMMYAVDPAQTGRNENRGRRVFTRPNAAPPLNWSRTIWDLLNITGSKNFNARKLYHGAQSRLSLAFGSDVADQGFAAQKIPPIGIEGSLSPEGGRSLAVVHVSTDATDSRPMEESRLG